LIDDHIASGHTLDRSQAKIAEVAPHSRYAGYLMYDDPYTRMFSRDGSGVQYDIAGREYHA
jgi:hypothetical protein